METVISSELLNYLMTWLLGIIFGIELKVLVEYYFKLKRLRES